MKNSFRLLALLILVSMVLAACPSQSAEPTAVPAAAEATTAPAAAEATAAPAAADATEAPAAARRTETLNVWSFTNEIRHDGDCLRRQAS